MRKTIILAIATAFLAGVSVVTGLARSVHGPVTDVTSTRPVVDPPCHRHPGGQGFPRDLTAVRPAPVPGQAQISTSKLQAARTGRFFLGKTYR
jgi:hypothetical protein